LPPFFQGIGQELFLDREIQVVLKNIAKILSNTFLLTAYMLLASMIAVIPLLILGMEERIGYVISFGLGVGSLGVLCELGKACQAISE